MGKEKEKALLVLTERRTRRQKVIKISRKNQNSVIKALNTLERKYGAKFKEKFKTITVDNGTKT